MSYYKHDSDTQQHLKKIKKVDMVDCEIQEDGLLHCRIWSEAKGAIDEKFDNVGILWFSPRHMMELATFVAEGFVADSDIPMKGRLTLEFSEYKDDTTCNIYTWKPAGHGLPASKEIYCGIDVEGNDIMDRLREI